MPSLQIKVSKEQLERLRKIAESKKSIMKYVGEEMVSDYIKKHEAQK